MDLFSLLYRSRFRQEYRLERKVLSELCLDPDTFSLENDELSDLISSSTSPCGQSLVSRHSISRVVVLHNNKLETFVKPPEEADRTTEEEPSLTAGGEFFDSPAFWSGAITWY